MQAGAPAGGGMVGEDSVDELLPLTPDYCECEDMGQRAALA